MSFMRGDYYIWEGEALEIFGKGGRATLPFDTFDELVVMRFAELTPKQIKKAELRAIEKHSGNLGCDALRKKHKLETTEELLIKKVEGV